MVRAPCCDKIGLKRGPWSPEEDHILASFIRLNGHGNWRALPKQAGLLRCGKSCRLRWINYLRSDIRRGNFSKEEEETIITLHQILGNRWSAIAARLPGRTDNEIKNVWHTHLKKKLVKSQYSTISIPKLSGNSDSAQNTVTCLPQQCSSEEISTVTYSSTEKTAVTNEDTDYSSEHFSQIDESFWLDVLSEDNAESKKVNGEYCRPDQSVEDDDDSMDFWYNIFMRATGGMTGICDFSDSVIFDL